MDQVKMGAFLRTLRKEKGMTQEELAAALHVGNRTISRWETGRSLPDLPTLIDLAALLDITVEELVDGERRAEGAQDKTVEKLADYSGRQTLDLTKKLNRFFTMGILVQLCTICLAVFREELAPYPFLTQGFFPGFLDGLVLSVLILGWLYTGRYGARVRTFKQRLVGLE